MLRLPYISGIGVFLWLAATPAWPGLDELSAERDLYAILDGCIEQQFQEEAMLNADKNDRQLVICRGLESAMRQSRLSQAIQPLAGDTLEFGQLLDLGLLVEGMLASGTRQWQLEYSELEAILAETLIVQDESDSLSWWDHLLAWLKEKLRGQDTIDLHWLDQILRWLTPSPETAEFIWYGTLISIALVAFAIAFNEIRIAGGLKLFPRWRNRQAKATLPTSTLRDPTVVLANVHKLSPHKQPAALLMLCINVLINRNRLPETKSSTNRELSAYLRAHGDEATTQFNQLVGHAERSVYGGRNVTMAQVEECFSHAETLLDQGSKGLTVSRA